MKIIFISGPYTGDGTVEAIEKNIREAERYQMALANRQIFHFCPHNHTEHFSTKKGVKAPEEFYFKMDFYFLQTIADAVLAVPGWEKSWGSRQEIDWAKENGLPIFYPKHPEDILEIEKWYRK